MKKTARLKMSFIDCLNSARNGAQCAILAAAAAAVPENAEAERADAGEQFYFEAFETGAPDQGVGTPAYCL